MSLIPSVKVTVRMARHRQTVADQIVLGLVTGGFLGASQVIEGRESNCIRFSQLGGVLRQAPDRGEILLSSARDGETMVECKLWLGMMTVRGLLLSIVLGAGCALIARWFGWPPTFHLTSGILVALLVFGMHFLMHRSRIQRQVEGFFHNTTYLKSM